MKLHLPVALLTAVLCSMSYAVAEVGTVAGIDRTLTGTAVEGATHGDLTVTIGDGNYTGANMHFNTKNGTIVGAAHIENGKETTLTDGNPSDIYSSLNMVVGSKDSEGPQITYLAVEGRPVNSVAGDKSVTINSGTIQYLYGGIVYDQGATSGNLNHVGNCVVKSDGGTRYYAYKDSSNPADLNITVNGGTVGQIRAGHSGKQADYIYDVLKDAQTYDKANGTQKYDDLMADKPWAISGNVNIAVNGGVIDAEYAGKETAIMGAGGSGHSVDGNVTVDINGGTIKGNIVAGSSNIYSEIGGSTLVTISGGDITGNVYAGGDIDDGRTKYASYTDAPAPTVKGDTKVVLSGGTIDGNVYAAGNGDIVKGNTNVVIDGTDARVTGVISGGGVNGATVEGDERLLTIQNSGGLGVSWDQIKDFNAVEFKNSQINFGTLSGDFDKVSAEKSHLVGKFQDGSVQLNATESWLEIEGDLTTTKNSSISDTSAPMEVHGNATFTGTSIDNATIVADGDIAFNEDSLFAEDTPLHSSVTNSNLVAGGNMSFMESTMNGGTLSVGGELSIDGATVVVDSINNGDSVQLKGETSVMVMPGDSDMNEGGFFMRYEPTSLTVNSDLKLAAGSSFKGAGDYFSLAEGINANLTANSITTEGAVTFDKADVTATVGDVSLSAGSKVTDSSITSTNGKIALDGITGEGTVTLNASTNGWSTITGATTLDDLVLNSGKYQVKQDATLTADTITVNATTYLDGQTTANKLTANEDTYIRYNGANIGELTIDGASFAVSNGALVEVGQLTASNSLFGLAISGTGTKVVVGDASSDVHTVNNSRLTATDGAQLVVNGTLQGNSIKVVGAADFDKVKGDYFRYTNTTEEHNVKVDSIEGYQAVLHNFKGDITIGKLVTEAGEVKASGNISLSKGTNLTYTQVNSSEGNVTLKGVTIVDSSLTATTGDITISDKSTVDGGSIVVGGALNLTNSNVTVDSLTGADGAGVKLNIAPSFNKTYLTVNNDLVLAEGSEINGGMMYKETVVTANSITGTGVTIHSADLTATEGNLVLSNSHVDYSTDWGNGKSTLTAEKGNVEISGTVLNGAIIEATNGVVALDSVTGSGTLSITASTGVWSSITGESKLDDLVLESGNLQVKKEATFTADTVTLNGQTYIDGTATIDKVVANDYLNARVNDINIGELELNGDQLSVSHGAAVTVGTLTATGKSISVSDTTNYGSSQLIIGTDSASVHNVAGTRFAVNGESVLTVNGTLKGDGIKVGGVAQIENVEGDSFSFLNTQTEGDLKLGSYAGNYSLLENRKGDIEIGKLVTESSTVKASGDITVGTGSEVANSTLNSSGGNITLTGTTAIGSVIRAANGTVTLNDSYASTAAGMDAQKVVVNSGSTLDVTVHGLTLTGTGKTNDEALVVDGTVNVTDSTLTIKGSNSQLGIAYGADGGTLTVSNSTVDLTEGTTLHMGYSGKSGKLIITNNSIFNGGSNNAWLGGGYVEVSGGSQLNVCTADDAHGNYRTLMGLSNNKLEMVVKEGSSFTSAASQLVTNFNSNTTVDITVDGSQFIQEKEVNSTTHYVQGDSGKWVSKVELVKNETTGEMEEKTFWYDEETLQNAAQNKKTADTITYLCDSGTKVDGKKYDAVNNVHTSIKAINGGEVVIGSAKTYIGSFQDKELGYTNKSAKFYVDETSSMTFGDMVIYADTTIDNKGSFTVHDISVNDGATVENLGSLSLNEVVLSDATLYNAGELVMNSLVMDNATLLFAATAMDSCSGFIYNGADLTGYGISNVSAVDMIKEFGVVMSGADAAGLLQQWGSEVEFSFTLAQGSADFEKHFAYVLEQNKKEFTITLGEAAELSFADGEIKNITVEDTEEGVVVKGIAVIPEPTTATLSLLALAALAARRRRK